MHVYLRIASATLLVACGSTEPNTRVFCTTPCGLSIAAANGSPQWQCEDYAALEQELIAQTKLPVCRANKGSVAWEMPGFSTVVGGIKASGWTECNLDRIMFHTGDGFVFSDRDARYMRRGPEDSAFTHELVHLAQGCVSPLPVDEGSNEGHSNWRRDGLFKLIEDVNSAIRSRRK